jgi:RecB family exonuclease
VTTFSTVAAEIGRDRWGRPLITPPGGGKAVPYTRVTTLAKTLEEQSALAAWKQRMTLVGVTLQPHLALAAAAARDDKKKLNDLAEQALAAAQAGAKAEIGTALHKLTEKLDKGEDIGPIPAEYQADLDAYRAATDGIQWLALEQFLVIDDLQVAGTADGIGILPDGRTVIADKKTGSIDYANLSIAVQLACYAHGQAYDITTGQRTPIDVDQSTGVVIHMPAGTGQAVLYDVDLTVGWEAALTSDYVRKMRTGSKKWMTPHAASPVACPWCAEPLESAAQVVDGRCPVCLPDLIAEQIAAVATPADLAGLWKVYAAAFTPELQELAAARHALLTSGLVA